MLQLKGLTSSIWWQLRRMKENNYDSFIVFLKFNFYGLKVLVCLMTLNFVIFWETYLKFAFDIKLQTM